MVDLPVPRPPTIADIHGLKRLSRTSRKLGPASGTRIPRSESMWAGNRQSSAIINDLGDLHG